MKFIDRIVGLFKRKNKVNEQLGEEDTAREFKEYTDESKDAIGALANLVPILGPLVQLSFAGVEATKKRQKLKYERRLRAIYLNLGNIADESELQEITNKNYFSDVLVSLLLDDESKKARCYANLTVNVHRSEFERSKRMLFLKILKSLSMNDLEMLHSLYVRENFELCGYEIKRKQLDEIFNIKTLLSINSINNLLKVGLITQSELLRNGTYSYKCSDDMNEFCETIFDKDTLTPTGIEKEEKETFDIIIEEHHKFRRFFSQLLPQQLRAMGFSVCYVSEEELKTFKHYAQVYIDVKYLQGSGYREYDFEILVFNTIEYISNYQIKGSSIKKIAVRANDNCLDNDVSVLAHNIKNIIEYHKSTSA